MTSDLFSDAFRNLKKNLRSVSLVFNLFLFFYFFDSGCLSLGRSGVAESDETSWRCGITGKHKADVR